MLRSWLSKDFRQHKTTAWERFTLGRLQSSCFYAEPAPPRAPPASGTASLRARRIGRQLPTSGRATRKQLHRRGSASSSRRKLPPEVDQAMSRRTWELSRDLESSASCSPWRPVLPSRSSSVLAGCLFLNGGNRKPVAAAAGPGESTPEVAIASGVFRQLRHGGDSSRLLAAAQRVPGDQHGDHRAGAVLEACSKDL